MPSPRIRRIECVPELGTCAPESGELEVRVGLEDGTSAAFPAATQDRPGAWINEKKDFHFGEPVLFVARLDQETVGEAVVAMTDEMSGYWLRYYKSRTKGRR